MKNTRLKSSDTRPKWNEISHEDGDIPLKYTSGDNDIWNETRVQDGNEDVRVNDAAPLSPDSPYNVSDALRVNSKDYQYMDPDDGIADRRSESPIDTTIDDDESREETGVASDASSSALDVGEDDVSADESIKAATLHGRHISMLTAPFTEDEIEQRADKFNQKRQLRSYDTPTIGKRVASSDDTSENGGSDNNGDGGNGDDANNNGKGGHGDGGEGGGHDDDEPRILFSALAVALVGAAIFTYSKMQNNIIDSQAPSQDKSA